MTPDRLTPELIVFVDGDGRVAEGSARPSSEWRMAYGTVPAPGRCARDRALPCARHATIRARTARFRRSITWSRSAGGASVPVAPDATFGSEELAEGVVQTLDGRFACLMANHGLIALGPKLPVAMAIAEEIEEQAAVSLRYACDRWSQAS